MPNQKTRKKKDGVNKSKKVQGKRVRERMSKPTERVSATGKRPGDTSKRDKVKDRPGAMNRA